MTVAPRVIAPRSPVFNAVSAGLLLYSMAMAFLILATPQSPADMMVPWMRPVTLLQFLVGAACVTLVWHRVGWAFYVWVGLVMFGVLFGLMLRYPLPMLCIGPALLGIYLWALHSGSPSMWVQMYGRPGLAGRGRALGMAPAMPPTHAPIAPAGTVPPPMPPAGAAAAPIAAAARPMTAPLPLAALPPQPLDPLDALKRLGTLRESGAITDAEFAAKKAEILTRL
jgi:hypothetical protein